LIETFFTRSCTIDRLRQGPLARHIDLLANRFAADGFSRVHRRIQIRLVGHFNRRLDQKGLSAQQVDEALIERYWRYLQRRKRVCWFDVGALIRPLDLLREEGITPRRAIEPVPTPRETLIKEYRCYLREERGLSQRTARIVLPSDDRFLARTFPRHHFDFRALNAKDVTGFVRKQAAELGSVQTQNMATALRGFFRYISDTAGKLRQISRRPCPLRAVLLVFDSSEVPAGWQRLGRSYARPTGALQRDAAIVRGSCSLPVRSPNLRTRSLRARRQALAEYMQNDRPRCSARQVRR
jgi:hypothetical protein